MKCAVQDLEAMGSNPGWVKLGCIVLMSESYLNQKYNSFVHIIQICSGITCGRVLNGEFYAQRLQKLDYRSPVDCREIYMTQPVDKCR